MKNRVAADSTTTKPLLSEPNLLFNYECCYILQGDHFERCSQAFNIPAYCHVDQQEGTKQRKPSE